MTRLTHNSARPTRGFTLMELMVVLFIIGLLMGIIVPAIGGLLRKAKANSTRASMKLIGSGCEEYAMDFGELPPSEGGQAAASLAMLLTGHAPDLEADTIPIVSTSPGDLLTTFATDDGVDGYGYRIVASGKVYGPYSGAEKIDRVPNDAGYEVFADGFGMPIYYYRATGVNDEDPAYIPDHELSDMSPLKAFENYALDGGGKMYRSDYILISAGADTQFTPVLDDPSSDDITNFSNTE